MRRSFAVCLLVTFTLIFGMALSVQASLIVVANDEWPLSDADWNTPDSELFALNVAKWFTGGVSGRFLVYSTDFGLTGSTLSNTMISAGNSWEIVDPSSFSHFDAAYLLQYFDAIFLAGNPADNSVLISYVNQGGNVYLAGGTGPEGYEEAQWNQFLSTFGLQFGYHWNAIVGNVTIDSSHPIFEGVHQLYQVNGNSIFPTDPANAHAQILVSKNGQGLYAVYEMSNPSNTLIVSKSGSGIGRVTSDPTRIDCGTSCTIQSANFAELTRIILTAQADPGSRFVGWTGAGCLGAGTCEFIMSADPAVTVTAQFERQAAVPALSQWGVLLFALSISVVAFWVARRKLHT